MFDVQFSFKKIREEAKEEGRTEGETAKALVIAKNMLLKNFPLNEIVILTGLTHEEVEALRDVDWYILYLRTNIFIQGSKAN